MKKLFLVVLAISLVISLQAVCYADFGGEVEQETAVINSITIQLNDNEVATVKAGNESFEIAYKIDCDGVLMGNGDNNGVLLLLNLASEITSDQYDLYTRNRTSTNSKKVFGQYDTEFYDVIITAYKVPQLGHYSFNSEQMMVYKTLEYYPGSMRNDGYCFGTFGTMPAPHLHNESGKYVYFLPLRYTFEELGFKVAYDGATKIITITK
jgi:hypothetical protein